MRNNDFDKEKFLAIIDEFIAKVNELRPSGSTTKSNPSDFKAKMDKILENLGYVSNFEFGQGKLCAGTKDKPYCAISFFRGEKKEGIRIWLGYLDKENPPCLYLCIGSDNYKAEKKFEYSLKN